MLSLRFKRPYYRVQEEGWPVKPAVVTFGRRGWTARACDHGEQGHEVIVEYKKKLVLDLWLITITFEWIGKGETCPNLKTMDQANV